MAREYTTARAKRMKHLATWIRTDDGGDDYLNSLWQSYAARPLYPLICVPLDEGVPPGDWLEVWDGNLRLEAALRHSPQGGDTELPVCIVTGEPMTPALSLEIQIESAQFTKGLSDFEHFSGYVEWLLLNPEATAKDLARRIHRDESIVCKILSLRHCTEAVKEAAREGRIGYSVWHQLSKLPPEAQAAALAEGATREKLQQRRRANGHGKAATVEAKSIPVMLTSGIAVTFKAKGLTLAMALDALADIKQLLKDAIDHDHDARTFSALMKKRAKELNGHPATSGGQAPTTSGT